MKNSDQLSCRVDTSFGCEGKVEIKFPGDVASGAYALAINGERLLLVARIRVGNQHQLALAGLTRNGVLDLGFADEGFVMAPLGQGYRATPVEVVASKCDGFVVLADDRTQPSSCPILTRYLCDGRRDHAFGDNGIVSLRFDDLQASDESFGLVELSNGKLMVAITRHDWDANSSGLLVRLHADGRLDTSFHDNGLYRFELTNEPYVWFEGVMQQRNGDVVVWGATDAAGLVLRLNGDDQLDPGFGNQGCIRLTAPRGNARVGIEFYHVSEASEGGLLLVGATERLPYHTVLAKLTASGNPDPDFNEGEVVVTNASAYGSRWIQCFTRQAGEIVTSGLTGIPYDENQTEFLVGRYLNDGRLDERFGEGTGLKRTNIDEGADVTRCSVAPDEQRLILGGTANVNGDHSSAYLVCYYV